MKTTFILVLCFILAGAFTTISAQEKSNGASQGWMESSYWSPVFCDGELVDVLEGGEIMIHYVFKTFKKGFPVAKEIDSIKGWVISQSGETFKIRETDKYYRTDYWVVTWHYNLIGDQGTHYTGTLTYDYSTGTISVGHSTCK